MKNTLGIFLICLTIIISVIFASNAFKSKYTTNDIISITGLGKKDFISDLIVWNGSFKRFDPNLQTAFDVLNRDKEITKKYLLDK